MKARPAAYSVAASANRTPVRPRFACWTAALLLSVMGFAHARAAEPARPNVVLSQNGELTWHAGPPAVAARVHPTVPKVIAGNN